MEFDVEPVREGRLEVSPGVRIWYRAMGTGPALTFQNGVGVTITFWEEASARLARHGYTSVIWDYRGHGRSDEPNTPAEMTLETCVGDLVKLLDHLELDRACLFGHSMGAQLGFEFYRLHPERVSGLVPTLGTYKDAISSFYDMPRVAPKVIAAADWLTNRQPGVARAALRLAAWRPTLSDRLIRTLRIVHPTLSPREWVPPYLAHMARLDPRVFMALARAIGAHDASDLLPRIEVPTLVVTGERDLFCPPRTAREMAERVPGAELLVIPGGSHAAIIEQPDVFELRVTRFLQERLLPHLRANHALH